MNKKEKATKITEDEFGQLWEEAIEEDMKNPVTPTQGPIWDTLKHCSGKDGLSHITINYDHDECPMCEAIKAMNDAFNNIDWGN